MNNKSLKIIFFGNTKFSLIGAKIIHKKLGLSFIVTIEQSPVAKFAKDEQIPFLTTKKLSTEIIEQLKKIEPDFFIVEDYGLILPNEVLALPKVAPLNIHHSLLPKYRGPTPAPTAILAGEKISGVSVIKMTNKVDAGDIFGQKEYELKPDETTESLLILLNELGGHLIVDVIKNFAKIEPISQPEIENNYTPRLTKQDGFVDCNNPPPVEKLDRMIRAYCPWPGVWTKMNLGGKEKIVKFLPVIDRQFERNEGSNAFSELQIKSGIINQKFLLQVEGKKPMTIKDFLNGYPNAKETIEKLFS